MGTTEPVATSAESTTEEFARLLEAAESNRLRGLGKARSGIRRMPFEDLQRLARLYRGELNRLARLRDRGLDVDQIAHLNALCVRAHAFLYDGRYEGRAHSDGTPSSESALGSDDLSATNLRSIARSLHASGPLLTMAWALMGVGAIIGFSLVRLDPTALYALMPEGLGYDAAQIDALYASAAARDAFFAREPTSTSENALFGASLFSHNTRVGILAFATGILAGIPTVLLQFYNGIMVGTIAAIFLHGGHATDFLAWILPHAVPELTAISLCVAAGFVLGRGIALPGRRTRSEAVRQAAPHALILALCSVPLFLSAAAIESFVRESALGTTPRFAVAAAGLIVLLSMTVAVRILARNDAAEPSPLDSFQASPDSGLD